MDSRGRSHVHMYVCMDIYTSILQACLLEACKYVHMYICMYACVYVSMYGYIHINITSLSSRGMVKVSVSHVYAGMVKVSVSHVYAGMV